MSLPKSGSTCPNEVALRYCSTSCQMLDVTRPMKKAIKRPTITPSFLIVLPYTITCCPKTFAGIADIQGDLERAAVRKLLMMKIAESRPAPNPTANFALRDLMKISVNWTSENHHQSVTIATMLEKKTKTKPSKSKNGQENFFMSIYA